MGVFLFLKASEQPVETTRMVRGSWWKLREINFFKSPFASFIYFIIRDILELNYTLKKLKKKLLNDFKNTLAHQKIHIQHNTKYPLNKRLLFYLKKTQSIYVF